MEFHTGSKKKPSRSRVQSGPLKGKGSSTQQSNFLETGKSGEGSRPKARQQRLTFREVEGDLFSCPAAWSLAHCVSEDMAMGKGVATLFKANFKGVPELKSQG